MRIKKIELIGFKSFADRTEIQLGEGVTCIVGPNGCGKSNISDALRWVFGERSAKLLRGTRMEDVIFNGSEFRKPLGMVEVSLTLENHDHRLPLEYDEIVLTRRMDRSGQSEYFLNRTPCRLKDILDLILDTGMGSNSYSMIEQGRVDSVINADPQERRFLIEEAAGISKYKVKKVEALRKLERTEQNLLRIRDIVVEVGKNIQYAERQARRAERYKIQFEELKKLEIQKALTDRLSIEKQIQDETKKKEELRQGTEKIEKELGEILAKQGEHQRILEEILCQESAQGTRCFELRAEHRSVIERQEFNRERLQECERRQVEIQKETELVETHLASLEKEAEMKWAELQEAEEEHQKAVRILEKEKEDFDSAETQFRKKQEETKKLKELIFENAAALVGLRNEIHRFQSRLETGTQSQQKRGESLQRILNEKKAFEKKREAYQEELLSISRQLEEIEAQKEKLAQRLKESGRETAAFAKEIGERKTRAQEIRSRLTLLHELHETAEESERKILESISRDRLPRKIVRGLREVLTIQQGYETAVEAVLGAFAQGLIAEDVETAKGLLQEMTQSHGGPCGIFIQSLAPSTRQRSVKKSTSLKHPMIHRPIQEVVQIKEGLEPLFESLFDEVYLVKDFSYDHLSELLPLAQEVRLVTLQGILIGPQATIFFQNGRLSSDHGPFRRRAEIEGLESKDEELELWVRQAEEKLRSQEVAISDLQEEKERLEETYHEILIRRETEESLCRGVEDRLGSLEEEHRVLEFESGEARQESMQAGNQIAELQGKISQLEEEEESLLERQTALEQILRQLQDQREVKIQVLAKREALLEGFTERLRVVRESEGFLRTHRQNGKERIQRMSQELDDLSKRVREMLSQQGSLKDRQTELEKEQTEAETAFNETRGRKAFQEEALRHLRGQSEKSGTQLKAFQNELHNQELKLMELTYGEKSLFERLQQTYGVNLAEQNPEEFLQKDLDLSALDEQIHSLKEKVESFGPVNLLAVEEYQELKSRYDFLAAQEKDLNAAREELLEAIRTINRTTKTLFSETFVKAQAFFQEYYQTLFGGGHAELVFVEEEDTQEPGVDIVVRPPGKKLQHISLLSGGEKALTAMALLFALFRIKPSPLCVLDEVDAPLDEANIDRFLTVLRNFIGSTQFLIVTHNRKTIAMGDYLYGVTMEEHGVSKIVSVKVAASPEKAVVAQETATSS